MWGNYQISYTILLRPKQVIKGIGFIRSDFWDAVHAKISIRFQYLKMIYNYKLLLKISMSFCWCYMNRKSVSKWHTLYQEWLTFDNFSTELCTYSGSKKLTLCCFCVTSLVCHQWHTQFHSCSSDMTHFI